MSGRSNASLCLPQGTLKSTTGVCLVVFFPSIHTSDHGIELIVIEQSPPPPPESSDAATDLRCAGAYSEPPASPPVSFSAGASRTRLRFGVGGAVAIAPPPGLAPGPGPTGGFGAAPPPAGLFLRRVRASAA